MEIDEEDEQKVEEILDKTQDNLDESVVDVRDDEVDEVRWNKNMEDTVEKCNLREMKKLLKLVMSDNRERAKHLEREKAKLEKQDYSELMKGLENMKRHVDQSNEKGMNEELEKMKTEIQQIKTEMEELKGRGKTQAPISEELRKEVEETVEGGNGDQGGEERGGHHSPTEAETSQTNRQKQRNWKEQEWMTEEKEREKRKNNLIIVGLEGTKRYNGEDIGNWLKQEIEVEFRIEKVWRVRTTTGKFLLGAQCGSASDKREVMKNKKKLGDKDIYIENDVT